MVHMRFPAVRSAGGGRLAAAAGMVSTPWVGTQLEAWSAPPPLYPAAVATLLAFIVVVGARAALAELIDQRLHRMMRRRWRGAAAHLRALSLVAREGADLGASVASFSATLPAALMLPRAEVRVELAAHRQLDQLATIAGAPAVAEAPAPYAGRGTLLPLVAENAEVGRVALAAPADAALEEPHLALGELLCALLALMIKNAEHRERLSSQEREMEAIRRRLASEAQAVRAAICRPPGFEQIVGDSDALRKVLALIERMAPSEVPILVTGETGTGKELVARSVHALSPRREGPLVTVNCPAIPGPLAESELFGHERGAFTDAVAARPGQFELAHGGTIFLDEIADLPLDIQAKLLRVLQEGEVRRVGGHRARPVDVRAVAATNRDLLALVREGRFREDLYYRLAAVEVTMPPLRDRHGDVPILATWFLEQAAATYGKAIAGFTPEAISTLCAHPWPGNVRQLQNVVHRAALLCAGERIRPVDLAEVAEAAAERGASFGDAIRQEKRRRFLEALHQTNGNQSAAARLLGMSRSNFARMVRSLGIVVARR